MVTISVTCDKSGTLSSSTAAEGAQATRGPPAIRSLTRRTRDGTGSPHRRRVWRSGLWEAVEHCQRLYRASEVPMPRRGAPGWGSTCRVALLLRSAPWGGEQEQRADRSCHPIQWLVPGSRRGDNSRQATEGCSEPRNLSGLRYWRPDGTPDQSLSGRSSATIVASSSSKSVGP